MAETVKGLKDLLKKLDDMPDEVRMQVDDVVYANALEIERNAKRRAPFKDGKLRQSIAAVKDIEDARKKVIGYKVVANATGLAPYAPYMEFGTGGLVDVPEALQDIAIQFKGAGVKQINIRPRPYLYPSFVQQIQTYISDLEDVLNDLKI